MAASRRFRKLRLTLHAFFCITLSVLILVIMLIEAGGLDGHANVTQSPAVFLWNLHFFPVHLLPCLHCFVYFIVPVSFPDRTGSIQAGSEGSIRNISSRSVFTRQKKIRSWAIRSCSSEIFPVKML